MECKTSSERAVMKMVVEMLLSDADVGYKWN
jgi:hypothetical protein